MTTAVEAGIGLLESELLPDIRAHADALDRNEDTSRRSFAALGAAGLLGLGAPGNVDGLLPQMADVIGRISAECMSTGFSLWAHRMAVEYLLTAATPFSVAAAQRLLAGTTPGVTGMASAFKDAAGCGSLDLAATPVDGGYRLSGSIRWASNLYDDSLMITAASTEAGEKLIVALPLNTSGVVLGYDFSLLAMGKYGVVVPETARRVYRFRAGAVGRLPGVPHRRASHVPGAAIGHVPRADSNHPGSKPTRTDRGERGFRGRGLRRRTQARGRAAGVGECGRRRRRAAAAQQKRPADVSSRIS